jgi:CheY-like chemotaxis protein
LVNVAILGFTAFERSSLASNFRHAVNRSPSYRLVTMLAEAQCVLVDSDHGPSVELVQAEGMLDRAVCIGAARPAGAAATLARPVDMLVVMRELDALVAQAAARQARSTARFGTLPRVRTVIQDPRRGDDSASPAANAPTPAPKATTDFDPGSLAPAVPTRLTPLPPGAEIAGGHIDIEPAFAPATPLPAGHRTRALLVDDSTLALRFLQSLLERHGVITDTATTSQAALAKLAQRRADLVFVDVELGSDSTLDGLALCQQIKRGAGSASGEVPRVALVSAHTSETDRARGLLAGCDAYFGKPIVEAELERFLAGSGPPRRQ